MQFDILKIPSLNIKKVDEILDSLENKLTTEEKEVEDLYRQQIQCREELLKPFEYQEELNQLLKRKNEIDNELKLEEEKPKPIVVEEEETEENEEDDYEEFLEDEEEEEYDI